MRAFLSGAEEISGAVSGSNGTITDGIDIFYLQFGTMCIILGGYEFLNDGTLDFSGTYTISFDTPTDVPTDFTGPGQAYGVLSKTSETTFNAGCQAGMMLSEVTNDKIEIETYGDFSTSPWTIYYCIIGSYNIK